MKEKFNFHPRPFGFKRLGFDVVNGAGKGALPGELKLHESPYIINYPRNKLPHLSSLTVFTF